MIKNVDDLKIFSEQVAQRFPIIANEIRIFSPGCSGDEVDRLKNELPNIPDSYLGVAKDIHLAGVSIGPLALWPRMFGVYLVDALIAANRDISNPHLNVYRSNRLIEVARWEANPVCLADVSHGEQVGRVYLINVASGITPSVISVANNFSDLLLVAANACSVGFDYESEPVAGLEEFKRRLSAFGLVEHEREFWLRVTAEMF